MKYFRVQAELNTKEWAPRTAAVYKSYQNEPNLTFLLFTQTFFAKCDILSDFQTSCLASLALQTKSEMVPFLMMDLEMKMSTFWCFLTLTKKWNIKFSLVINWRRRVIFLFFQLPVLCHVDFDFLPILLTYDIARFSSKTQQKADC